MKSDTVIILAAAAAGLFFVARLAKRATGGGTVLNQANRTAAIANTALPGQEGWGWQYFSDGTAIGPDGRYYLNGTEVYNPAGMTGVV